MFPPQAFTVNIKGLNIAKAHRIKLGITNDISLDPVSIVNSGLLRSSQDKNLYPYIPDAFKVTSVLL